VYELIYENEIIRLRRAKMQDVKGIERLLNDPDVMLYFGESESSYEYALSEMNWFNDLFEKNSGRWVIEDIMTGEYIGDVGVFNYDSKHKKGEIGYLLDKNYWGKGIMSNCVQAVLDIAFKEFNYNRVEALVDVRNDACIALLKKSGFLKEGTLRDYEFEHGGFVNLEMHSILKREHIK